MTSLGHCRDATMLRDTLVGLIELMLSSAGAYPLELRTEPKQSSDNRPPCLENPRPEGAESTLTENAASPFHAEPKQFPSFGAARKRGWLSTAPLASPILYPFGHVTTQAG